ncbi:MAG TPA: HAD family phosphatase [Candidatus Saccharimonadales bacterium]|nr:HAD family phosphatase [Candidatus Saccharimonadales bacterium]
MAKKTVIFDMDGVIVDSEPLHIKHLHAYLVRLGVDDPASFQGNLKGVNARDTWTMLIKEFDLEEELDYLIEDARKSYVEYLKKLPELPSIPGAKELIKQLHKDGYRLALASSAAPKRIELFLNKLNLKSYFDTIVSGDDVPKSKPEPDIFLLAAKKMKAKPGDCVVIEDAKNGVQAAKAAGMKCIAYAGSDHNTDDVSGADTIIKDFTALTRSLQGHQLPV